MANGKVLKGPYWTRNWIEAMWRFTNENFVDFDTGAVDYEALGKEEFQFRKALFFRNFKNSERAKMAFASAEDDYKNPVENGKKGGRPKKSPQDAPNGNAGVDMSDAGNGAASKSPTSCDTFTAAAATREGVDVCTNRESGASARTTGCNHSCPDASIGNAEGVVPHGSPITRNGSRAACTSATSGQTIEAPQNQARESQPGAGEVPPENVSAKPSPALPVPSKKAHGEFGNVLLTDDEFAKLCEKCPDADALITELDQYIESQGKTKKYKSHYATLLNWSRRKAQEAKPQQRYKNINDINQENYEKAMREIEAMCAGEAL